MFKTVPYKIMTKAALMAIIVCGSIGPTYAFPAESNTITTSEPAQKGDTEKKQNI